MRRVLFEVAILLLLAWAAMNLSLFGVGDRVDKYVQDIANTHFWRVFYPHPPRSEITVVLLTEHALTEAEGKWPAPYDFHGRVLKALLTHRPKAVFIDFLWLSQRQYSPDGRYRDGGFLFKILREYRDAQIPVYLAGSGTTRRHWCEGPPEAVCEMDSLVEWVAVPLGFDPADFVAREYPPKVGNMETAAFRMARDLQLFSTPPEATMDIVWGRHRNEANHAWMALDNAALETSSAQKFLKGYSGVSLDVPYTTTLFVRDLLNPRDVDADEVARQQRKLLGGKLILYGANLEGVNDLVFTPARNMQPGVYFHAMALDNLLNWGGRYKSEDGTTAGRVLLTHDFLSIIAVFPVALLLALFHHTTRRLAGRPRPRATPGQVKSGATVRSRTSLMERLVLWNRRHMTHPDSVFFAPLRFLVLGALLWLWFGAFAWFEYSRLNYSASVIADYLTLVAGGFLVEKTRMLDRLIRTFHRIRKRWMASSRPAP